MRDGRTDEQTTSEDRATQLLICEALSLAIIVIMETIIIMIILSQLNSWPAEAPARKGWPTTSQSHTWQTETTIPPFRLKALLPEWKSKM